jgi:hypothetical protein
MVVRKIPRNILNWSETPPCSIKYWTVVSLQTNDEHFLRLSDFSVLTIFILVIEVNIPADDTALLNNMRNEVTEWRCFYDHNTLSLMRDVKSQIFV